MAIIFHITAGKTWRSAVAEGVYRTATYLIEGFIHCSTADQVIQVANIRFHGQTGLVLLSIDTDKVTAEIVYENLEGGSRLFPHIYGELNTNAVIQAAEFEPGANGHFTLPEGEGVR
jgi:uncharacterized protein (DUF952 family)